jgi:hypothetical protein
MTTSYPAVFSATDQDLGTAVRGIREALHGLPEPRLYAAAFVLAALVNRGAVTWWGDWNAAVPVPVAVTGFRGMVEDTMWAAFGFPTASIFKAGTPPVTVLGNPQRVLVDPFYDAQHAERLTVVKPTPAGVSRTGNSIKVPIDDGAWIWSASSTFSTLSSAVEYNPVNTYNQQNGLRCALPAQTAIASGPSNAAAAYRIERSNCPNFRTDNNCGLNDERCASDGAGGTRISKPRVIVPSAPAATDWLLTPTAFDEMISRARVDKHTGIPEALPRARDLALVTGWAHQGNGQSLDFGRLVGLLGPTLLPELVDP